MTIRQDRESGRKGGPVDLMPDEVYEILSHPYRRYVLAYLHQQGRPIGLEDLAAKVASWETETDVSELDETALEQATLALYHTHLPRLVDAGLVEFTRQADGDEVELTANIEPFKPSLNEELDEEFQEFYTT